MSSPWSSGFDFGFGPLVNEVSGKDPATMQTLGYTTTQTLLYDYGNSEAFYLLKLPPEVSVKTLYATSPLFASQWFGINPTATTVYNPFQSVWYSKFSNLEG